MSNLGVILCDQVVGIIENVSNVILFSQISLFELAIKFRIGKLTKFLLSVEAFYLQAIEDGFIYLPIQNEHIFKYQDIPLFENHRDPFDRLLIATAIEENTIIFSGDEKFKQYSDIIEIIW